MVGMVLHNVKARKFFYRNLYRKELVLLVILTITAAIWTGLIMVVAIDHMRTVPYFYASSSDGILTPLKAMPSPNNTSKALLE
jgi:hypothetical protein